MDGLTYMADHLFIDDTQDVEGKFIGWDYAHAGDYTCYYGDDEVWKDEKKWTTQEIFEEVKDACFQLKFLEDDKEDERMRKAFKYTKKNFYKKAIKEDVWFMLVSFGLSFLSILSFFFTNLIFVKVLNIFNVVLLFFVFIKRVKIFKKDLDKLADIDLNS